MCAIYYDIAKQIREHIFADPAIKWYQNQYKNEGYPIVKPKLGGKKCNPKHPDRWITAESVELLFGRKALEDYGVQTLLNIYVRLTGSNFPVTYSKASSHDCVAWLKERSAIMRSIFPEEPNAKQGFYYPDLDELEERINAAGTYITDSSLIDVMHI